MRRREERAQELMKGDKKEEKGAMKGQEEEEKDMECEFLPKVLDRGDDILTWY